MTHHGPVNKWLRTIILALAVATLFQTSNAAAQETPTLKASPQPQQAPKCRVPAPTPPNLPKCPKPLSAAPPPKSGQHTVTLSWNANPPSTKPTMQAVGYCLYRSKTQNAAKNNPLCSACEQINPIAFPTTTCLDDQVEDTATYYYVVTAANAKGAISKSSNEATASIANAPPPKASVTPTPASSPK